MKPISDFFVDYWSTVLHFSTDEKLLDLRWEDFVRVVSVMNIKSCGTFIEKRILARNKWKKIKGHESHGDAVAADGKIIEVKSSIITPMKRSGITFRGIRPWHKIDEHHFILIDLRNYKESPDTITFKLNHDQIVHEHKDEKALRSYTMKRQDRMDNKNIELGTSFKKNDLERWKEKYSSSIKL